MSEAQANVASVVTPPTPQTLPSGAHAIALAEKTMADKINAAAALPDAVKPPETEAQTSAPASAADPASKRISFLAKKEREIIQQARQAKQDRAELHALRQQIEAQQAEQTAFWEKLQKEPLATLAARGLTYDKLTEAQLANGRIDPTSQQVQELRMEQERLKQRLEDEQKQKIEEQRQQAQEQTNQVLTRFKGDIHDFVSQKPDEYEQIHLNDAEDHVFETAKAYFERTGKTITIKEAADMVEDFFYKHAENVFQKSKKLQSKFGTQTTQSSQVRPGAAPAPSSKTLTNQMSPGLAPESRKILSEGEAIKRALAKMGRGT